MPNGSNFRISWLTSNLFIYLQGTRKFLFGGSSDHLFSNYFVICPVRDAYWQ